MLLMVQRTESGMEARLKVAGFGRFIGAAFLSFWLAGWAAGEAFALWMLGAGAYSLFTGRSPLSHHQPSSVIFALAAGGFLLFWLSLWTLGGIAAGHGLLRLMFGRDHLLANHDGFQIVRNFGLFRTVKHFAREHIRRFYRNGSRSRLCLETTDGVTEIVTQLGTAAEQSELEQRLNEEFRLESKPSLAGALPKDWRQIVSPECDSVLVKDPAIRRKQARTMWILCTGLSLVPLYLLFADRQRPDLLGGILFSFAAMGALGWGAVWLSFGRSEWRLGKGRLILQRRFGQNRTPQFEAISLELVEDNSGDDGPTYVLSAVAAGNSPDTGWRAARQHRRTIWRKSEDPTEPRNLGLWLSERCGLAFTDLPKPEVKAIELEGLKQQLAASGRLGRALAGVVDRLAPSSASVSTNVTKE